MASSTDSNTLADRWVTFNPNIKVLDCTVRDGGLINNHQFDDAFVKHIYQTAVDAGVDYCELGYKGDHNIYSPKEYGPWRFCTEDDLRRIVGDGPRSTKIAVMADAERTDSHAAILPRSQSVIDCIRVACYIHQIPVAMDMVRDAHEKGYETMMQLMAVSNVNDDEIESALEIIAKSDADGVYVVDSFGALYSEQVRRLTQLYLKHMEGTGKEVGFHAHNNMQLAFANTIEAIVSGATRVDATVSGLGRGAGNCPMELILGFLHNPKYKLRPVLACCQEVFVPLAKKMDWGYSIPYAITGRLNMHPRDAMEWRAGATPDDYVGFYDAMGSEDH